MCLEINAYSLLIMTKAYTNQKTKTVLMSLKPLVRKYFQEY